jgi:hypothetical protein
MKNKRVIIAGVLLLILFFTVAVSRTRAVAGLVQEATNIDHAGTGTTFAKAFTDPVTSRSMIIGAINYGSDVTVSVADTLGNIYTVSALNPDTANGQYQRTFYANSPRSGANTVTVTFGGAGAPFRSLYISEYSGLAQTSPNDGGTGQIQLTPGTGTDAITSGNIVTTVDGDLIWGITDNTSETSPGTGTLVAGTGYTQDAAVPSGGTIMRAEHKTQTTAGSVATTFTTSVDHHMLTNILAFKVNPGSAAKVIVNGARVFINGAKVIVP